MEDLTSVKVSATMRNAISVNSHKTHQLEKKVKNLEAERDMRLLNLQIKRDEMYFDSPSARRKLIKSPTASDSVRAGTPVSQLEIFDINPGLHKDEEPTSPQKSHNLPPLHLDQAGLIATPPRIRKAGGMGALRLPNSPNSIPQSPLESSVPSHKRLARQSSSPLMPLKTNSTANVKDLRRENSTECKHQFSPRLRGSSVESPASPGSPEVFKFDPGNVNLGPIPQRPSTATSSRDQNRKEVHRGLLLRPISSSKEQTKPKEKKESVFNRLYSSGKKRDVKMTREAPLPLGNPKLDANTRRRSISLSDLSEILGKLKTCRYLRDNSHETETLD